jgi:REP element-mobilizing transposase RayT
LFGHRKEYTSKNNVLLDIINGVEDHVHCLIRLKTTQSVADVIRMIKGESSFWINKNVILDEKFEWQDGYGVISVSPKEINGIRQYIYYQEAHHKNKSLKEELKEFKFTKKINKPRSSDLR